MNMPVAISVIFDIAKQKEKSNDYYELIKKFDKVLSLDLDKFEECVKNNDEDIPNDIKELLEKRKEARINKDYALSDTLRDEIKEKGYIVKDTKDGQKLEKV